HVARACVLVSAVVLSAPRLAWAQSAAQVKNDEWFACAVSSPLAEHAVSSPLELDGGIHAAIEPASGEDTAPESSLVIY
ncbi:hypothetical protein ACKAW2_16210, partial [Xanthomonas vasicola]